LQVSGAGAPSGFAMIGKLKALVWWLLARLPAGRIVAETRRTQTPVRLPALLRYLVGSKRGRPYWPIHSTSIVVDADRIVAGIETSPGLMPGCYIQGSNGIEIGDYTQIAANVVMISANHALTDNRRHVPAEPIRIGEYCWLGANVVILPGVQLGTYTVVGAGAVVTKSFADGYCVIGGNPARLIRRLNPEECVRHRSAHEYNGFIVHHRFEQFRRRYLSR
jgi:acetyltransferase-like isoleucine patch superfamily enzyme